MKTPDAGKLSRAKKEPIFPAAGIVHRHVLPCAGNR